MRKFAVIWKAGTNKVEFWKCGARRNDVPTLQRVIDGKALGSFKLPAVYAEFRHFEKTGEFRLA
jgi:hypothetical protein